MLSRVLSVLSALALSIGAFTLSAESRDSSAQNALPAAVQSGGTKAGGFRAAAVKVDITPKSPQWLSGYGPRQSTGVLDPIYHRVVALDGSGTPFYLIASDLCLFSPTLYDSVT
jgi:hypothetical protein